MNNNFETVDGQYAFISYSHADKAKVFRLLRVLKDNGKKFWFDKGIEISEEWLKTINDRIEKSSCFLLFLSNGAEQRAEVVREIKLAIQKRERTNGEYKIFIILLERVPVSYIFRNEPEILKLVQNVQYISLDKYKGITLSFVENLINSQIWAEDTNYDIKLDSYADIYSYSNYIYPMASPEERTADGISFYTVRKGETDPNTVYPVYMDDQWCPSGHFDNEDFRKYGFKAKKAEKLRNKKQEYEIYRALIHNWQILINRASVFNSRFIIRWYEKKGNDYDAFCELLENGSFVIYLMYEKTPIETPKIYVSPKSLEKWISLCREHKIYCIRMHWYDEKANQYDIERFLVTPMKEMFLTIADDRNRMEVLCRVMNIDDEEEKIKFRGIWKKVQKAVMKKNKKEIAGYTRSMFYENFLIRKTGDNEKNRENIVNCVLDYKKDFVCELKQTVDFYYTVNLPNALHIQPVLSLDNRFQDLILFQKRAYEHYRIISAEEVYCSVITFKPTFLDRKVLIPKSANVNVNLSIVNNIRKYVEWRGYMEAIDAGRKRANLNEVDFSDVEEVWERYNTLLKKCSTDFVDLDWKEERGSLSVIYRIGNFRIVSVYIGGNDEILIYTDSEDILTDNSREVFTIDFICGNIAKVKLEENCFLTNLKLFEGISFNSGKELYKQIYTALTAGKYKILKEVNYDF